MTRQAFLAQMPVPPTALCLSCVSSPRQSPSLSLSLSLSLCSLHIRFCFFFSLSLSSYLSSGPLSPPSHQKSRAIALGGLSTLTDSPVPPSRETCTRFTVFEALTTTTTATTTRKPRANPSWPYARECERLRARESACPRDSRTGRGSAGMARPVARSGSYRNAADRISRGDP